jgi:uncharacterized protein (TIRG00374 family)
VRENRIPGKILHWIFPLAISGVAIGLVLKQIEFAQFTMQLSKISWEALLMGAVLYLVSYLFRVFCWFTLLKKRVSFKDAFFVMGAGYLLNNIFPFRLGEIGRAVLLDDPKGPTALEVFSSVIMERVLDVFLAAVFLLSMIPRLVDGDYNRSLVIIFFILSLIGLAALYTMARFRQQINHWLSRREENAGLVMRWVTPKAAQLLEGLSVLENPASFFLAFGSLAISWAIAFVENFVIFSNLTTSPPFWWMVFGLSAGAFGAALPSAPSGIGVFEGVMVSAFALVGVDAEIAFTHAIVIHVIMFVFSNIIGLIGLKLRGEAVIDLYHRVVKRSQNLKPVE